MTPPGILILAAGMGSRLRPLNASKPKALIPLLGAPLLARQISVLKSIGIEDITLVGGYGEEHLRTCGFPVIINKLYETTNMVESMMCARTLFDGSRDIIVAYGDIVYQRGVVETLLGGTGDITVAADHGWQTLWAIRMEDPLQDAESFRLDNKGNIAELGKRPDQLSSIQGQYLGLIKIPDYSQEKLLKAYEKMDRTVFYDGQPFLKIFMTSFLQYLIDKGWVVRPAWVQHGWLEIDTKEDLRRYEELASRQELDSLCHLDSTAYVLETCGWKFSDD